MPHGWRNLFAVIPSCAISVVEIGVNMEAVAFYRQNKPATVMLPAFSFAA